MGLLIAYLFVDPIIMAKDGTNIIIEDDLDDQFVLEEVFIDLEYPNKWIYFPNGESVLDYLNTTTERPFSSYQTLIFPK